MRQRGVRSLAMLSAASMVALLLPQAASPMVARAGQDGAVITGEVSAPDGTWLAGICVLAWDGRPGFDPPAAGTWTDAWGDYELHGVPPGDVLLYFWDCNDDPAYEYQWWRGAGLMSEASPIHVAPGGYHTRRDVVLRPASSVAGRVTSGAGGPVPGACVDAFDDDGTWINRSVTDSDGHYHVATLRAGAFRFHYQDCREGGHLSERWSGDAASFDSAQRISLAVGQAVGGADTVLTASGAITGTVTDRLGAGLDDVCASVHAPDGAMLGAAITAEDGSYRIDGVPPGSQRVRFGDCRDAPRYGDRWFGGAADAADAAPVSVEPSGTTAGISAALDGRPATLIDPVDPATWMAPADGVDRWAGSSRVETAARIAAETFPADVDVAFVATAGNFPDALAGGPLAALAAGPVLLVTRYSIPNATVEALERLRPRRVVVLGGEGVVAPAVSDALVRLTGATVDRLAGASRHATAAAVSRVAFAPGVPVAYVATGGSFPDALAGGPLAARRGAPVLLTGRDALPAASADELRRLRPEEVVVLGGPGAVSDGVLEAITSATGAPVRRLAGPDRFATAAAIAEDGFSSAETVVVATGMDYPDALTGVPAAGLRGAPLLLVTRDAIPTPTAAALNRLGPRRIVVLGGAAAVGEGVLEALREVTVQSAAQGAPASPAATEFLAVEEPDAAAPAARLAPAPVMAVPGADPPAPLIPPSEADDPGRAYASTSQARVWRGGIGGVFDLQCGRGVVGVQAPAVTHARPGQYAWWRSHIMWVDANSRIVATGPWYYAFVTGGYNESTTRQMTWIRYGEGRTLVGSATFAVSPGFWGIIDEVHVDGVVRHSLAWNRQWNVPYCYAGP